MKKYKIVGICQIYNEMRKGNLERFVTQVFPLVDEMVVYDDGSTDGGLEFIKKHTKYILRGVKNDFKNEVEHRKILIEEALKLSPDFILWLDADEVMTSNAAKRLPELCSYCTDNDIDGISLHELNLWRSHTWRRIDSLYDDGWFPRLWKVNDDIRYKETKPGLHQKDLVPPSIKKIEKVYDVAVLHYGFASEKSLAYKYLTYKAHGQSGYVMLDRLIDEHLLELEKVQKELFPADLWVENDPKPEPMLFEQSLSFVEEYREEVRKPSFTIICLIYKSLKWARFIYDQVLKHTDLSNTEFFFIANDAEPEVIGYLQQNYIPHFVFDNTEEQKREWYINNVYRAYNFGAQKANGDFLVFINSDMAFTSGWMETLWDGYTGDNCVSSRLVEAGRLKTGQFGLERDFGDIPENYNEQAFLEYAEQIREPDVKDGGLYMPLMINKNDFLNVGGYPEGNLVPGSNIFVPKIAKKGEPVVSGDLVLMQKLESRGIYHQTAFNSVVYHFQMGEMRDHISGSDEGYDHLVAVCNDLLTGSMGERVFWDFLLESLPAVIGIDDMRASGNGEYSKRAHRYLDRHYPELPLIIQNATFIGAVDPDRYTIMFLQDNLRAMGRPSEQQELNLKLARKLVTNSIVTAASYPEFDFEIIPVGVDDNLFCPMDKKLVREEFGFGNEPIGIFVGSLSEVKGWSKICECIEKFRNITWIVVSKYDETYSAPNVRFFNKLPQNTLVKLLNCADFFIVGSPVETQCLAAIEACLCNVPVIMNTTGIFTSFSDDERSKVGIFGGDFIAAIEKIPNLAFSPRQVILNKNLTTSACVEKWKWLIVNAMFEISSEKYNYKTPQNIRFTKPTVYRRWRYPLLAKVLERINLFFKNGLILLRKFYFFQLAKRIIFGTIRMIKKPD
jgi:glycosyltransferase involved in cell wall biosynthesis